MKIPTYIIIVVILTIYLINSTLALTSTITYTEIVNGDVFTVNKGASKAPTLDSYYFNSTSDLLAQDASRGQFNATSTPITVVFWANYSTTQVQQDMATKFSGNWGWILRNSGTTNTINLVLFNSSFNAQTFVYANGITTGTWHQYGFIVNGSGEVSMIVDGKINDTGIITNNFIDNRAVAMKLASRGSEFLQNGSIDEFRIYNVSLNSSDILQLNNTNRIQNMSLLNTSLIDYLSFDNSEEITITGVGDNNLTTIAQFLNNSARLQDLGNQKYLLESSVLLYLNQNNTFDMNNTVLQLQSGNGYFNYFYPNNLTVSTTNFTVYSWNGTNVDLNITDGRSYMRSGFGNISYNNINASYLGYNGATGVEGFQIQSPSLARVTNSYFSNNWFGLIVRAYSTNTNVTVENNIVSNMNYGGTTNNANDGIDMQGVSQMVVNGTIVNNTIFNLTTTTVNPLSPLTNAIHLIDSSNLLIKNNNINNTDFGIVIFRNSWNNTIDANSIYNTKDHGIKLEELIVNTYVTNNIVYNTVFNFTFGTGIGSQETVSGGNISINLVIVNNTVINSSRRALRVYGQNVLVENNTLDTCNDNTNGLCTGFEILGNSTNFTIRNNTIRNFLRATQFLGTAGITLDANKISNVSQVWLFDTVSALKVITNFTYLINWTQNSLLSLNTSLPYFTSPYVLNNTGTSVLGIQLLSLVNPLVYNPNNTVLCTDIPNCVALNTSLPAKNYTFVLNNFNLTEGINRTLSPIWFSSVTSTSKHIASNLTQIINAPILSIVDSCSIYSISYSSNSGNLTSTYNSNECTNNLLKLNITGIETANSSNVITIVYSAPVVPTVGQPSGGTGTANNISNSTNLTNSSINLIDNCMPLLNTTISIFSTKFDMDTSLPFFNVGIGNVSCGPLDLFKWVVRFDGNGRNYNIIGIKLWWIMSSIIIYLGYIFSKAAWSKNLNRNNSSKKRLK